MGSSIYIGLPLQHWNSAHRLWRRVLEPRDWKQFYKHPKFQFTHKLTTKSRHNLTKSKIFGNAVSPMQSEWRLKVFSLPFTLDWRCNISENLLFVRLWCKFIVNLWVNWNFLGCLKNCFQSPGRIFIVCARCFSAFCACPELCYDFERPKVLKFWVGCVDVHTSILTICVCFSNCCFGILMLGVRTRVSLSNRVFDKLIRAVSVWLWKLAQNFKRSVQ